MRKAVTIIVAALALAACGTSDPEPSAKPKVATLQSAAPSAKPPADEEDKRPLIRADTSREEVGRMGEVYNRCLRDHGLPGKDLGHGMWKPTVEEESGTHPEAFAACHGKQPEIAMERLKRQNFEEYADRYHAFVKCIQDAGVDVSVRGDGPLITFNKEGDSFDDRVTKITENCSKLTKFQ
ncbi:hypothetical protein AB0M54_18300 [Actinoplanes sp. NPDC051470]|uniref:hypothetical protein n=1 Tax=unclassified Actinoplanes TaxID=2626549 RepID=UPI003428F849